MFNEILTVFLIIVSRNIFAQFDEDSTTLLPLWHQLPSINNCSCREIPGIKLACFGKNCRHIPMNIRVAAPMFKLRETAVQIINIDDLLHISNIEELIIDNNEKLTKIVPGCFRNMKKLKYLTLANNHNLRYLDDNVFEGLDHVVTVYIRRNGFKSITDVTRILRPKYLPNLITLNLIENRFTDVQYDAFYPMNGTRLQALSLYSCETYFMHSDCLHPLRHLTTLELEKNLLDETTLVNLLKRTISLQIPLTNLNLVDTGLHRTIPYTLLEAIANSNISNLNVGRNHFDEITNETFPVMPNLKILDLRDCLISHIWPNAFSNLVNIQELVIRENQLMYLPSAVLLETLTLLDSSRNSNSELIFSIEGEIFRNMAKLLYLHLSYNNIGSINNSTLYGLKNLQTLNLKNANLHHIEAGAFLSTPNLLHLNLSNNHLLGSMPLTAETFSGLSNLQTLFLSGCNLQNLTANPSIFTYLSNLTYLNLENNNIRFISPYQIKHLLNLNILSLSDNKLYPWLERILPDANLNLVSINKNKLGIFTPAMLEDWQNTSTVILEDNPFRCDCSLYPIVQWLKENDLLLKFKVNFVLNCDIAVVGNYSIKSYLLYLYGNPDICVTSLDMDKAIIFLYFMVFISFTIIFCIFGCIYKTHIKYWMFLARINLIKRNLWQNTRSKLPNYKIDYKYDVFVSYSNTDRNFVKKIVYMLEENEPYLKLCLYERDFPLGAVISETILRSVALSKRTLLVVSNAFAKSQWCRWEAQLAEYHQLFFCNESLHGVDDTLLIIKLEQICKKNLTPTLKYLVKTRIYLEWSTDENKQRLFWIKLKTALSNPKAIKTK